VSLGLWFGEDPGAFKRLTNFPKDKEMDSSLCIGNIAILNDSCQGQRRNPSGQGSGQKLVVQLGWLLTLFLPIWERHNLPGGVAAWYPPLPSHSFNFRRL